MLAVLAFIVVVLACAVVVVSAIRRDRLSKSKWVNPDFIIREFDSMPDQTPVQPIKINPPLIGLYKTQYVRKGVTITETKFWAGDCWVDVKERNLISFEQKRSWEML